MDPKPMTDEEIQQFRVRVDQVLEDCLASTAATADELFETAARQRRLAAASDSRGQRKALLDVAAKYEAAAHSRPA